MREYDSVITAEQLAQLLKNENPAIIDCRYDLFDSNKGRADYNANHIPGAIYAHLKHDLAGDVIPGTTGRHPLPDIQEFSDKCSSWGISNETLVVAYDDNYGAMAARLWWLLKWLGHDKVAVLDGGFDSWIGAKLPTTNQTPNPQPKNFIPNPQNHMMITSEDMEQFIKKDEFLIIDSRANERYLGLTEPIDPIAGHIPGAINHFYKDNNLTNGTFKSIDTLKQRFSQITHKTPADNTIFYCGSGVTGAHNILAYYHAGLGLPKLYAGSWSEWISNPNRPVITQEKE